MATPYAELRVSSAFSFLEAASQPEDLVARAAELGLPAVALVDRNGVYGAPRFWKAAQEAGIRPLVGAEVVIDEHPILQERSARFTARYSGDPAPADNHPRPLPGPLGLVPEPPPPDTPPPRLTLLAADRSGYRNLCRLLTAAAAGWPKGQARATWRQVAEHSRGLHCLTGGDEGLIARRLSHHGLAAARHGLEQLVHIFPERVHVELQRHHQRHQEHRNQVLIELARHLRLPLLASNGVRYARPEDKQLADVLTCIREGVTLDTAGALLDGHRERYLRSPQEMAELFADQPAAVAAAAELAETLEFTLDDLGYRFPDYPLPAGETTSSYLRQLTWNGARARFRPLTARAQAQLEKELSLIEKLDLAGYFLIVWDIVRFCQREQILAQGRGSAANSAVCYALSITAVDPVRMELLFERFLSEERGEWPDIDLDLPSGGQREKVIQYVYQRYGARGAAMTANVITYRARSAAREVGKALGLSLAQVDRIAKQMGRDVVMDIQAGLRDLSVELGRAGLDPESRLAANFQRLWWQIRSLPRHLGQHSGGMVLAAGRLDDVVPLEPAAMADRTVVQWDKDDLADLGIIKVDLLGLGMLAAIEEAIPMIRSHEGVEVDLAHLPAGDRKVYDMICRADTVGLFQIESRAQMASLPRNRPRRFYDLVVQVAIIRPGPISGRMTHPYLQRRQGREPVVYPHPSLEPALKRTLGVPIFQEQLLRIAMVAADFSGGEAEELRRAMGFKRSNERMKVIGAKLRQGMTKRGITGAAQEEVVRAITSFALYGFPESHAASFALIVYASAYLKAHHPTAFYASLLNAWPMGFYHPSTLVKDAQRHGVTVLPVDINRSGWRCRWEKRAVRLGLRYVKGLSRVAGLTIEAEQRQQRFASTADLSQRCQLSQEQLSRLAHVGALASLGLSRRQALWQVAEVAGRRGPLLAGLAPESHSCPLPEMTPVEKTEADYAGLGMTTGPHLVAHIRKQLDRLGVTPAGRLGMLRDGVRVRIAGAVIVRQRPGTAKGILFITLEDETGMIQAIIQPELFSQHRALIIGSPMLIVEGSLQKRDGTISVKAEGVTAVEAETTIVSHDFH
jgi:error-prone DNA polymerase